MKDIWFTLEDRYTKEKLKCAVYIHDEIVTLGFGVFSQVRTEVRMTHLSARELAEMILASVPAVEVATETVFVAAAE